MAPARQAADPRGVGCWSPKTRGIRKDADGNEHPLARGQRSSDGTVVASRSANARKSPTTVPVTTRGWPQDSDVIIEQVRQAVREFVTDEAARPQSFEWRSVTRAPNAAETDFR
ncbi:Imm1 family immunity protein [Kribbella speibonae]